jgi:peroxygenase
MKFWDRDNDGTIWPLDTYHGFREIGFDPFVSFIAMPIIHGTFSYWTLDTWIPHPGFPIRMGNSHKTKHGSDSESYDTEGRFVPEKFEEIFTKYDKDGKNGLTLEEVQRLISGNRNIMDPVGWIAGWLEWNVTYYLAARPRTINDKQTKVLSKDDALDVINGTYFFKVAKEIKQGKIKRASWFEAGLREVKPGAEKGGAEEAKKVYLAERKEQ